MNPPFVLGVILFAIGYLGGNNRLEGFGAGLVFSILF